MPIPTSPAAWWGSLIWLLGLTVAAFGVAWLSGTRLQIRKPAYIPLLLAVTAALAAGYVAWLGIGFADVLTARWGWGIVAGIVAGGLLIVPASHQPVDRRTSGRQRAVALGWEGAVYGIAEGVLLSALGPFMVWQAVHSLGWSGTPGGLARWTLPVLAAAAVVVIHHLGYWNYRNRILVPIALGLTVLTVAFLLTGSWIAPALGHIVVHTTLILRGSEMPPQGRPEIAPSEERILRAAA